jgi:integrative and conjugative element protein (TIGR02256 family)
VVKHSAPATELPYLHDVLTGPKADAPRARQRLVAIKTRALDVIRQEVTATAGDGLETGGILLGHEGTSGSVPTILVAGDPGPRAIRQTHRFSRDRVHAQALADRAWSQHQAQWIGDWHTHPGGLAVPSDFDMSSYARQLADPDLDFTEFITLIVATRRAEPARLAAWVIDSAGAVLATLQVIDQPTHPSTQPDAI